MAEATLNPGDNGAITADAAPPVQTARGNRSSIRSLAASTTGQLFEWYEWTAYAVFAPYIAAAMFNNDNPVSALLATLAVVVGTAVAFAPSPRITWEHRGEGSAESGLGPLRASPCL